MDPTGVLHLASTPQYDLGWGEILDVQELLTKISDKTEVFFYHYPGHAYDDNLCGVVRYSHHKSVDSMASQVLRTAEAISAKTLKLNIPDSRLQATATNKGNNNQQYSMPSRKRAFRGIEKSHLKAESEEFGA